MARTMVNLVGNCLATAVMARWEGELGAGARPPALARSDRSRRAGASPAPDRAGHRARFSPSPSDPHDRLQTFMPALPRPLAAAPLAALARQRPRRAGAHRAPPRITNIRYEVTFDSRHRAAAARIKVADGLRRRRARGRCCSRFPAWTPGAYEITNFARWVSASPRPRAAEPLTWDKLDYDTWRMRPGRRASRSRSASTTWPTRSTTPWPGPGRISRSSTAPTCFLYPEGRGFDFPATVTVKTQPGWLVATGMQPGPRRRDLPGGATTTTWWTSRSSSAGFDCDSTQVAGKWTRLATYPAGRPPGRARDAALDEIGKMIPAEAAVFRETPWHDYTILMIFDSDVRRRQRAGAHQLARRDLQPAASSARRCSPRSPRTRSSTPGT